MAVLDRIQTIAVVMMENRSFDHMLGHMSLPRFGGRRDIEGLEGRLDRKGRLRNGRYENPYRGDIYRPHLLEVDEPLPIDVPHERDAVTTQMGDPGVTGAFPMNGFAAAYLASDRMEAELDPKALGFFGPEQVPITRFLADEYMVCDHWFSSIPTSTQPNRAIGLSGEAAIDRTKLQIIPAESLVLDWLTDQGVRWRVYHDGLSFFVLFGPEWIDHDGFRSFDQLRQDITNEPEADAPEVLFIEPSYQSAPHLGADKPNDNHAPLPVRNGEHFLRQVYLALTANEQKWAKTLLIVTYDEHGGFWDHVPPPTVRCEPPPHAHYSEPFTSMGPRVPTVLVSPFIQKGSVCQKRLDNTSILQLLAEKFGDGDYSESVSRRRDQGDVQSVSAALDERGRRPDIPSPPPAPGGALAAVNDLRSAGFDPGSEEVEWGFRRVAERYMKEHPARMRAKY
ncbi:MAG TPA: alkaline phosphatase family protein, partial [Gammaproteobacteria bacterium]|nr:alkaline phosphatase family protein [Gammaproteobacteria bacterium]